MAKAMAHMAVTVKDMDASLRFYVDALGLTKAFEIAHPETGDPWIVYLNVCKGQFVELFFGGKADHPWVPDEAGFNHLCFEVEDIQAATQRVIDAGFQMDSMPRVGSDHNWQSWTRDPNGIRIELMQIDPRSPHFAFM